MPSEKTRPYIRLSQFTITVSVITIGINPYLYIKGETLQYQNYTDTSFCLHY
jgi:hypothetical protein